MAGSDGERRRGVAQTRTSIFRERLFAGQVIVVSGGGTGIGRAIARGLAGLGAHVILCSRDPAHLEPTRAELTDACASTGATVDAVPCNIRDPEAVERLFAEVVSRHGQVDGLVNNAGGQFLQPAEAITPNGWHAVIETNLTGTFNMCRAAYHASMGAHGGAIVNIVMENWRGFPLMAHSAAARAGVVNLTQTLAVEWAPAAIRVNAVAPGVIDSSGLRTYPPEVRASLGQIAAEIPAGRLGTEDEVAAAVAFLLSPAAAFISGQTLKVDGAGSLYRLQGYTLPEHPPWPAYPTGSSLSDENNEMPVDRDGERR